MSLQNFLKPIGLSEREIDDIKIRQNHSALADKIEQNRNEELESLKQEVRNLSATYTRKINKIKELNSLLNPVEEIKKPSAKLSARQQALQQNQLFQNKLSEINEDRKSKVQFLTNEVGVLSIDIENKKERILELQHLLGVTEANKRSRTVKGGKCRY